MKNKKYLFLSLLVFMLLAIIPVNTQAASVKLNKKSVRLIKGQSCQLKITGTSKKVKWSSSKSSVAKVSSNGKITARKKGTTTVKAKVSGKTYTCKVKVYNTLTKEQAVNAVLKYCSKKYWYSCCYGSSQKGNICTVWIRYGTGAQGKYLVNVKNGSVKSYAPYWGKQPDPAIPVTLQEKFNALNYL